MSDPNTNQLHEVMEQICEGKTSLYCSKHFYTPSRVSKPAKNCSDCYRVMYWTWLAKTPTDEQAEFVDGLEMTFKHMVEHIEKGTWDYMPNFSVDSIGTE